MKGEAPAHVRTSKRDVAVLWAQTEFWIWVNTTVKSQ